jgi:hypothetical protein
MFSICFKSPWKHINQKIEKKIEKGKKEKKREKMQTIRTGPAHLGRPTHLSGRLPP